MPSCEYCNNLNIPSYETVARSRNLGGYDGISAISAVKPGGPKPFIGFTAEDILNGADVNGCEICISLKGTLTAAIGTLDGIKAVECLGTPTGTLKVKVAMDNMFRNLEMYTLGGNPSPWPIIGPAREVSLDSSSDECFSLAASWVKDCIDNHTDCFHNPQTPLPTRVLAVGSGTTDPFLYVSKQENARYTTLSHCWGGKMPMTTTLSTFEERRRQIRFADLPKTFQDAITITRELGVHYIWIDSLCIIQDSEEDWTKEAAKMGSVYRNCLVCIAANGALDSNGGCFIKGNSRRNYDIASVKCKRLLEGECEVHIREQSQLMAGEGFAHIRFSREFYQSKLDIRCWVLQEQALTPRTLHYTATELAWDCTTCIQCECTSIPDMLERTTSIQQLRACKRMMQYSATVSSKDWEERSR